MSTFQQRRTLRALRASLAGTAGFVAFWAFIGATGLIGGGADLGEEITYRLPFGSPALAGLLLAALVGVPMTLTAVLAVRAHPSAGPAGIGSGLLLLGWVTIQPLVIGQFNWLQLLFGAIGAAVILLGHRLHLPPSEVDRPRLPHGASSA